MAPVLAILVGARGGSEAWHKGGGGAEGGVSGIAAELEEDGSR